ncbi:MAG: hypothetical protein IKL65_05220 [Bacilli bacterium]|nr:hypothetical protein [Bacilli bacterium]
MQEYNNGHVIDVSKVSVYDYEIAAKQWAEGSKGLEELLLYCLKNNIVTQACCIGHKVHDMAFLQFELSEKNIKTIIKIINRYYNLNGVNMTFVNQPGVISKFDIRVPKNIGEQFFKDILLQLSNGLDIEIDSLPLDMKKTINAMMKHKVPNEYLEVQYSIHNNQKNMFIATTNPNYSELYWDKEGVKPWTESSIAIEGTPEIITPIIDDIYKKASIEYINYVEHQRRLNNQYAINTPKQQILSENISKDEFISILANPRATQESDYVRENNMIIFEALPGMSIDDVAKVVCGKRCICKFNNFEIDGTKYQNAQQIVASYNKELAERKKELKKQQEQFDLITNNQELISDEKLRDVAIKR